MSRRTAKKRLKKINQIPAQAAETPVSASVAEAQETTPASASGDMQNETVAAPAVPESKAPSYEMFLQYQNSEFLIEKIAQRILDKCTAEGMDSSELKIYVKPEDRKVYYACAGGSSCIDL